MKSQLLRARRLPPLLLGALFLSVCHPAILAQSMLVDDPRVAPVVVETASVTAEVAGTYAVTTFDLVFRNPNNRQLEGTFEFPLLEGQSVIRFALDIGGKLREAVPVEKEKGRAVFEEIERRRVDPGLLEKTVGNNYRARVFPLPARGTRRIVIAYQEALGRDAKGAASYRLALNFAKRLERFDLAVAVRGGATRTAQVRTTLPLQLPEWNEAQVLSVRRSDFSAKGLLELTLPRSENPAVLTQRSGDREYFCAEVPLAGFPAAPRPLPKVVGILWDASGSGAERDHARELAFLDAYFRAVPDVEVRLVLLRDTAAPAERFAVNGGQWPALRRALETVVYDGATALDGLAGDKEVQEWLLFSDGIANYGATEAADQLAQLGAPIHTVLASLVADAQRLRAWSERSGGVLANLLSTDALAAVSALRGLPLRVWGVERDPAAVAQMFPEVGAVVTEGRAMVAGILRQEQATIRLRIGRSGADAREIVLPVKSGEGQGTLAARAWATAKIDALSLAAERNGDDIRRTSREFGIVTADTSLIVLETIDDYLRYEIEPPEELRDQWRMLQRDRSETSKAERASHLDAIAVQFEARMRWWNDEHELTPSAPMTSRAIGGSQETAATDRLQTTPQPPVARARSDSRADDGDGTVVGSGDDEVVVLSPFVVSAESDFGYRAADTLAGTRIRTELRDIGSAVSVLSDRVLRDSGATNNRDLLTYTSNTEVGGVSGNFAGTSGHSAGRRAERSGIALQRWQPAAGYLDHIRRSRVEERYSVYLEERADHRRDAGFYLDMAGAFIEGGDGALGLRILSNLAELQLEDAALLRVLGSRLLQAGRPELALPLFERVLKIRGEEPQSRRDLALACAAVKQYQRAVDLLWAIVEKPWHNRFPGIELLALGELNAIVANCGTPLDLSKIDPRLRRSLPVGLRVVLTWDADNCDIDLWVDDPAGERAIFSNRRTRQGGLLSCDFREGYGPEEFVLRKPLAGKYTVRVNYFGDRRNTALGPVTAQVRIITGYGTPEQKEQRTTVRLAEERQTLEIGSVEIVE